MDTSDQEDQQLVARIAGGDEAALQALLQKYSHDLYQFASSVLNDHELSQQTVLNVFISLWRRRHTLRITTSVYSYLFTCTNNQSFKMLRKRTQADEVPIDDVLPDKLIESSQVDQEVQFHEFMGDIEAVVAKMPAERQKVFRMNIFENIGYKDIAQAQGISVRVVQKHMFRAREQITAALPKLGYRFKQDSGL